MNAFIAGYHGEGNGAAVAQHTVRNVHPDSGWSVLVNTPMLNVEGAGVCTTETQGRGRKWQMPRQRSVWRGGSRALFSPGLPHLVACPNENWDACVWTLPTSRSLSQPPSPKSKGRVGLDRTKTAKLLLGILKEQVDRQRYSGNFLDLCLPSEGVDV